MSRSRHYSGTPYRMLAEIRYRAEAVRMFSSEALLVELA